MKGCCKCKEVKPLTEFSRNKSKKDGLSTDCKSCVKQYLNIYRSNNKEILYIKASIFREENRDKIREANKAFYNKKKEDYSFVLSKRKRNKIYKINNKGKINADTAKRYSSKLKRSTITTVEDFKLIEEIYKEAKRLSDETGILHHVDHIIPLNGKLVSGLHVPRNLQILTWDENVSKSNKFII